MAGRSYVATQLSVDGEPVPLGPRPIRLSLEDGDLWATVGCNSIGGAYDVDRDRLVVKRLRSTAMWCFPSTVMRNERLVSDLLSAGPRVDVDGERLELGAAGTVVSMVERPPRDAADDRPLRGTRWVLTSYGGSSPEDSVARLPKGVESTLRLSGDQAHVDTGCNRGSGPA